MTVQTHIDATSGTGQPPERGTSRRWRWLLVAVGLCTAVVALLSASTSEAPERVKGTGSPDFAAIDRYVRSEMSAQRIPGLALGIVHGGQTVHLQGFGEADSSGRKVTPQTPFLVGSVTKSFTAMAIMQLSEAGQVDLDAPVQRYLPWWRVDDADASARMTVRQLLNQVSGLSKATGNAFATSDGTQDTALEDRVRSLRSAVLTKPVGTAWQYSNANYWTLGMIVQAVSGQPYETYIQKHIFGPLDMHDSFTSKTEAEADGLPIGHRYWYGFPVASDLPFDRGGLGAGGLSSSAADMTHYLSAYLLDGRYADSALVSPAGAQELQRRAVPTGLDDVGYAMGWEITQRHGLTAVSHDGSGFDYHANVVFLPEREWGVVVMENAENSADEFFGSRRMTAIAFGVTDMLTGRQPKATSTSMSLRVTYGVVLGIIILQIVAASRSVRRFRRWHRVPGRAPRGPTRIGVRLLLPLLTSCVWAYMVLVLLPRKVGAPLSALVVGLPDLAYPLIASAVFALTWGVVRTGWAIGVLRLGPTPASTSH